MDYLKKLDPDMDLNEYFESEEFSLLEIGLLDLPSGKLTVADPLCNLEFGDIGPFTKRLDKGAHRVTLSVFAEEGYNVCYLAAKLSVTNAKPVRYQLAMKSGEYAENLGKDEIFGFPAQSGLACFCDADVQKAYGKFCANWKQKHPNENMYDTVFAPLFAKNAAENPQFQQQAGDWLDFDLPNGDGNVMMFNSGFGDGVYPCYYGYDARDRVACVVVQFISPAELI